MNVWLSVFCQKPRSIFTSSIRAAFLMLRKVGVKMFLSHRGTSLSIMTNEFQMTTNEIWALGF